MEDKIIVTELEKYYTKIGDEKKLGNIFGVNPNNEEINSFLKENGIIFEYINFGKYLYKVKSLEKGISNNWKDGLKEDIDFFKIEKSEDLDKLKKIFLQSENAYKLESERNYLIEQEKIISFLKENLSKEDKKDISEKIIKAKNKILNDRDLFTEMKKFKDYFRYKKNLNVAFGKDKNKFNNLIKKFGGKTNE